MEVSVTAGQGRRRRGVQAAGLVWVDPRLHAPDCATPNESTVSRHGRWGVVGCVSCDLVLLVPVVGS